MAELAKHQQAKPIWLPDQKTIDRSNIVAAMKQHHFLTYEQLYQWSIDQREDFWSFVVETLGIQFERPFQRVMDTQTSDVSPRWFTSGQLNIAESCFSAEPDSPALVEGNAMRQRRIFTYGQLRCLANQVARSLLEYGVEQGQSVAIFMPMNAESVAIYLGIVLAGCTVVSIADSFSAQEVQTRLRLGQAQAVFTVPHVRRGNKELPILNRVVEADGPAAIVLSDKPVTLDREEDVLWTDFLTKDTADYCVHVDPDTAMNVLFSSGTTGEPKAIIWDHTTPIKSAADGYFHHDIHPGEVVTWPTNLGWMMGPWLIFATLINRGTIAIYDGYPSEPAFVEFIQNTGVSMLGLVPSLVRLWRQTEVLEEVDWSGIKTFSSTGECSSEDDMRWLSRRCGGKPIIEYCGGTEIGGGYIASTLVQPNWAATFSTPALGSELIILDEEGQPADTGELFLVPPALGLSSRLLNLDHDKVYYADAPTGPRGETLRRHGDQIEQLTNGYYRAIGRTDDTMNLGGIKVGAAEIERVLGNTPEVREVAAISVPPAGGGPSQLVIFVGGQTTGNELLAPMRSIIKSQLNPLFSIHEVVVLDQLPRTASNKIMRRKLRESYLQKKDP